MERERTCVCMLTCMRGVVWIIVAAALVAADVAAQSAPDVAEPPLPWRVQMAREPDPELEAERPKEVWSGWQSLTIDAIASGLLGGSAAIDMSALAWGGTGMLVAGAPIVHVGRRNVSSAAISFGIRLAGGLLMAAGVLTAGSNVFDGGGEDSAGIALGAFLLGATGVLAAIAVDAAVLGWRPVATERSRRVWVP